MSLALPVDELDDCVVGGADVFPPLPPLELHALSASALAASSAVSAAALFRRFRPTGSPSLM
jgi:hypothetical protein